MPASGGERRVLLRLHSVGKSYGKTAGTPVLRGVSLNIAAGELCAITGASGSGKTTLLNIIGLLDQPSTGRYYLAGHEVSQLSRQDAALWRNQAIGFVFQSFHLLPRLTAIENVALPLIYQGVAKQARNQAARVSLERVGLGAYLDRRPDQMSGGQRQRVAIARAMIAGPMLLLADEPTGNLDSRSASEIMDLFIKLNQELRATVMIVTHDSAIAELCQRQIVLRDGAIIEDSLPDIVQLAAT